MLRLSVVQRVGFVGFVMALLIAPSRASDPDVVGDWTFDEGAGQVAGDSSASGNEVTGARRETKEGKQ